MELALFFLRLIAFLPRHERRYVYLCVRSRHDEIELPVYRKRLHEYIALFNSNWNLRAELLQLPKPFPCALAVSGSGIVRGSARPKQRVSKCKIKENRNRNRDAMCVWAVLLLGD